MVTQLSAGPTRNRDSVMYHELQRAIEGLTSFGSDLGPSRDHHREVAFAMVDRTPQLFSWHYLLASVSSKFQHGTVSSSVREATALDLFARSEATCADVNRRLCDLFNRPKVGFQPAFARARRIVSEILGRFDFEQFARSCAFSSGASTEARRQRSMIQLKWGEASHITKEALPYYLAYSAWAGPIMGPRSLTVVPGNVVFTVPKNYARDRICAKEPSWNMFFQKGLGSCIRRRLQRVGLLHPDAQETHARLALSGSRDGQLATLDLKGASDAISTALVEALVPDDWLQHVLALRSPVGRLPCGTVTLYEKISSMGNGFTFELETLLFYALSKAVSGKDALVSVYGDDIIVPVSSAQTVVSILRLSGFETNPEKSFTTGPFRESCGGHFFNGSDAKPFYVSRFPTSLSQTVQLHNDVVGWIGRTGLKPAKLLSILRACRAIVPRKFWGPLGTDGCLWSEWDEATPRFVRGSRRLNQPAYQHWRVATIRPAMAVQRHDYLVGGLLASLAPMGPENPGNACDDTLPTFRRWTPLAEFAAQDRSSVLLSELTFEGSGEVVGWVAVDVGQRWPSLPVRLA